MAQLWLKSSPGAESQGPFTAIELRNLAAAGHIPHDALISLDQSTWRRAAQVKGLYPTTAQPIPPRRPHVPPEFSSDEIAPVEISTDPAYDTDSAAAYEPSDVQYAADSSTTSDPSYAPDSTALPTDPIDYAAPHTEQSFWNLHPRGTLAFTLVAFLLFLTSGGLAYLAWLVQNRAEPPNTMLLSFSAAAAFFILAAVALVLWLVWVYGIHKDLRALAAGRSISPGLAVGFSFIPIFDAFWAIYMPARACGQLNELLAARGLPKVSKALVATSQFLSILFAVTIPGLTPMFYALSMRTIQKGMNRLIASQS